MIRVRAAAGRSIRSAAGSEWRWESESMWAGGSVTLGSGCVTLRERLRNTQGGYRNIRGRLRNIRVGYRNIQSPLRNIQAPNRNTQRKPDQVIRGVHLVTRLSSFAENPPAGLRPAGGLLILSFTRVIIFVTVHLRLVGRMAGRDAVRVFLSQLGTVLEPFRGRAAFGVRVTVVV